MGELLDASQLCMCNTVTREQAKRMAYGIVYGQSAATLAPDLGVSAHTASELIQQFMGYFGEVRGCQL